MTKKKIDHLAIKNYVAEDLLKLASAEAEINEQF